jgi:hypothetical protein
MSLTEQLAQFRAGWHERVPADRQQMMLRHIQELRDGAISKTMLKVGDRAPSIVLATPRGRRSTSPTY